MAFVDDRGMLESYDYRATVNTMKNTQSKESGLR